MLVITQARQSGGQRYPGDVERLPDFVQSLNQLGSCNAISDPQTGEPLDFRKCPERDNVAPGANEPQAVRRIVQVLVVRLVDNDDDAVRNFLNEAIDFVLLRQRARWIVGISNENEACLRSDGRGHGIEIVSKIPRGNLNRVRSEDRSHEPVNNESMFRRHDLVASVKKGVAEEFDDLIGTGAEN